MSTKTLGDYIHEHLLDLYHFEEDGWARDLVDRVGERLQGPEPRFLVHVPWMDEFTAFTAPGRHIFISRQMLERCRTDEMAAMIVAHEIAHHDLDHLKALPDWLRDAAGSKAAIFLSMLKRSVAGHWHSAERERDADLHGLDLCLDAGYDGLGCLELFEVLEKEALDRRALDVALGPDDEEDPIWASRFAGWLADKCRSHPPIHQRREDLLHHLRSRQLGGRPWTETLAEEKIRKREESSTYSELRPVALALGNAVQSTSVGRSLGRLGASASGLLDAARIVRRGR